MAQSVDETRLLGDCVAHSGREDGTPYNVDSEAGSTSDLFSSWEGAEDSDSDCSSSDWSSLLEQPFRTRLNADLERKILEPFTYIQSHSGKHLREALIDAFNVWFGVPPATLDVIKGVVASIHDGSLILDDIEDYSAWRRGVPATHVMFGVPLAINTAHLAIDLAKEKAKLLPPMAFKLASHYVMELLVGQALDVLFRDSLQCPTDKQYVLITRRKTGALFRLSVRMMMTVATKEPDRKCMKRLVDLLGIYYQIRDDYCNLGTSETYTEKKTFCEDLTEGKFNFLIKHAVKVRESNEVLDILKRRTSSVAVKKECVALLQQLGSFEHARKIMRAIMDGIRHQLLFMEPNEAFARILLELEIKD